MNNPAKIRAAMVTAAATLALAAPVAVAHAEALTATSEPAPGASLEAPSSWTEAPGNTVKEGDALTPPPVPANETPAPTGEVGPGHAILTEAEPEASEEEAEGGATTAAPAPGAFTIPSLPSSSCAISGVPPVLIPIYQRASDAYGLGPQGPAVLAGINAIETGFGQNLGPSSAGA